MAQGQHPPAWCEVRTVNYAYTMYQYTDGSKEAELYDLGADPDELRNVASDPSYAGVVKQLQGRLEQLCNPPPPKSTLP